MFGGRDPPALDHQFFFSTNFLTIAKKKIKNHSEYSMDAMYLNLMFINPRPPVGAGAKATRCTRPSLTPPPLQKNPGSAPALSCVSLSCANLSLSLTSQISQWSSSIETTSSDQSVNRKLQVLSVSSFIKFKSKHSKFFTSRPYINSTMLEIHHAETQKCFCCRVLFWKSHSGIDCVPL